MKRIFNKTLAFTCVVLLILSSCKKDGTPVVASAGTASKLTVSKTEFTLTEATANENATAFTWTSSSFGFSAVVTYELQFAAKGTNFAGAASETIAPDSSKTFTVGNVNALAIQAGLAPDKTTEVEVRVKASLNSTSAPAYSNVVVLKFAPYRAFVTYPSLYVPGAYQGWNPGAPAPTLASVKNDKTYEGYIDFGASGSEFKINSDPDWNHTNYGGTSNTLSTSGGNLSVATGGVYMLKADINGLTWSATKIDAFSVNGTASGNADKDLSYDSATKTWRAVMTLAVGTFKFRANHAATITLGDKTPVTTFLTAGGTDIAIDAAGSYEIVLSTSIAGNYYYEINKQ
ncbi:hypothetical protein GCM10023149_26320 [Mucilaginibacter gynuensis]|uniref:SusE outer membrane protein domain-containing protein n=1 Tax=Mucilaginibacter gynuensis TaxID=1302236 RepID=A0ABP8GHN7_9SPHI